MMHQQNSINRNFELSRNIFSVSSQLLGISITALGIVHATVAFTKIDIIADDLMAANSLLFLAACLLSYIALRLGGDSARAQKIERAADYTFLAGLCFMVVNCFVLVYAVGK